jgi:serine/threonine protein kinase
MQVRQLGSYELIRRLGEGGMARVYLARDVRLGREVAVKMLDPQLAERPGFRERFLREARVAASLDHPHIVPLYDFGDSNSFLYLVMPYVSGGSLQDMLKRTPLPVGEVVAYGSQIGDALDYAHQRKVIHRDVKPANMLLHADGRLMLSDFGLAKILDTSRPAVSRGHPDAGTPEYMAPEQIEGHTDERSDVYALGVVLYLLLTGRLPFTGSSSGAVMDAHLYHTPTQPRQLNPGVTPAIQAVVLRALAKRADDRFQRAGDLSAALLTALVAGEAEPLPFFPEGDTIGGAGSSITPRVLSASHPHKEPPPSPAPLPWELPDWEATSAARSESPSLPLPEIARDLPGLGKAGPDSLAPAAQEARMPVIPETAYGWMPVVDYSSLVSPKRASGQYPALNALDRSDISAFPSHASGPMRSISQVTGPFPALTSRSMPPTTSVARRREAGPRLWLWMVVALLVLLLALAILLRWFVGSHATGSDFLMLYWHHLLS